MANRSGDQSAASILQTVLTAKSAGVELDKNTQGLIHKLLHKQLATLAAADAADEAHKRQSIEQAKRLQQQKDLIRRQCAHMKTPQRTALQGQRLDNGQVALVCSRCGSLFHTQPKKEEHQVAPPAHLIPQRGLGGAEVGL